MAVAWNAVRAKLASSLPGVVGQFVTVYDGPVISGENPPAALTIAYAPSLTPDSPIGRLVQDQAKDGYSATETGSVVCEVAAITGDSTVPDTFTIFGAIAAWLQADQTLGGTLNPGSTCYAAADVIQAQTTSGAVQRLIVTITYFARI